MENRVRFLVMRASCYPPGTEGGGDVEATSMGIDIEDLSCKVETRNELAF